MSGAQKHHSESSAGEMPGGQAETRPFGSRARGRLLISVPALPKAKVTEVKTGHGFLEGGERQVWLSTVCVPPSVLLGVSVFCEPYPCPPQPWAAWGAGGMGEDVKQGQNGPVLSAPLPTGLLDPRG